ncbi:Adenine phosphoribosyltransferase [Streptomyces glaucescens]
MTDIEEARLGRIRDVADYPEPGVVFKDITPLLADPAAFTALTDALARIVERTGATKVVGLEARGFILGAPVAVRAGVGFIPVRKARQAPRSHPAPVVRPGVRVGARSRCTRRI